MKKLFTIAVTALMLLSCNKNKFSIDGSIDPSLNFNGQTILLCLNNHDTLSSIVADNRFSFHGAAFEPQIAWLEFGEQGKIPVFVEQGNIEVEIETEEPGGRIDCEVSGTPNNDLLRQFFDDTDDLARRYSGTDTDEDEMFEDYVGLLLNFIRSHANTAAGRFIFSQNAYMLTPPQLEEHFARLSEESMRDEKIDTLYKQFLLLRNTSQGSPYIDIKAPTPDGTEYALSQLVGTVDFVLVDFWASWCGPCRRSMPAMKALYAKYAGRMEILGVSLDADKRNWTDAIQTLDLPWKHISDLQGWQCEGAKAYGVNAIPATVLINREGVIIGRNLPIEEIEKLLAN